MKKKIKLSADEYREYMDRELLDAHSKYPLTEELRRDLWKRIRTAEHAVSKERSGGRRWGPAFAGGALTAVAGLVALFVFLAGGVSAFHCSVESTQRGGQILAPGFLKVDSCVVQPDFRHRKCSVRFSSGFDLEGSLAERSADGAQRFYKFSPTPLVYEGLAISGEGVLEIVAPALATGTPVERLKRGDISVFRMNLTLSGDGRPYPPISIDLPPQNP